MDDIEFRVKSLIGKGKNMVYYKTIDTRPNANYFLILREYRKELNDMIFDISLSHTGKFEEEKQLFRRLYEVIPHKVKSEEVDDTLLKIKSIFDDE